MEGRENRRSNRDKTNRREEGTRLKQPPFSGAASAEEGEDPVFSLAHFAQHSADPFLVDRAQSRDREAQSDISVFFRHPNSFSFQIGEEAAIGDTGDLKTNPFFLLGNPAERITAAKSGFLSSDSTNFRHKNSL